MHASIHATDRIITVISSDIQNKPQLAIFVYHASYKLDREEEWFDLRELKGTTQGSDTKAPHSVTLHKAGVPDEKTVTVTTNSTPTKTSTTQCAIRLLNRQWPSRFPSCSMHYSYRSGSQCGSHGPQGATQNF